MTSFAIKPTALQDPSLRVNYTFGQVLGVDEFAQEQLYHVERQRLHQRLLHGYGTVWGLHVSYRLNGETPELQVRPGVALNPLGQEIRVAQAMCADLNAWLVAHASELDGGVASPPSSVRLCLVLRYCEARTHPVPIRGEPCQSSDSAVAASRITPNFELELHLKPASQGATSDCPAQPEEDGARAFGKLLGAFVITDNAAGPYLSAKQVQQLVRALLPQASPVGTPIATRLMRSANAPELLEVAMRTWVTEVRPQLLVTDPPGPCEPPRDRDVLLAEVELDLVRDSRTKLPQVDGEPRIDERNRPLLLSTRLLQEWLRVLASQGTVAATGSLPSPPNSSANPLPWNGDGVAIASNGSSFGVVAAGRFNVLELAPAGPSPTVTPAPVPIPTPTPVHAPAPLAPTARVLGAGPSFNDLAVTPVPGTASDFIVSFAGYKPPGVTHNYLIMGVVEGQSGMGTVELMRFEPKGLRVAVRGPRGGVLREGFTFSVQVDRIGAPP